MGVKISELQEKTSTNDTDVLPIVDAMGGTKKITVPNLLKKLTESISNIGGKVTNLTTYSTNEVKTGECWIDGKPIYRKTYSFTIPTANQEKLIAHNIKNVKNIWLSNKSFLKTEDNCIPVNHYRDSGTYIWCLVNSHDIRIKTGASGWTNNTTYVTIEYTKTTD